MQWPEKRAVILLVLTFVVVTGLGFFLPFGVEWQRTFRQAALDVLAGRDPYTNAYFFNAPWTAILILPFALLPVEAGRALFFAVSLFAFAYVAVNFSAHPITLVLFLLSPPVLQTLLTANVGPGSHSSVL